MPSRSPSPDPKRLFGANTRIGADEIIDDEDDLDDAERKVRDIYLDLKLFRTRDQFRAPKPPLKPALNAIFRKEKKF